MNVKLLNMGFLDMSYANVIDFKSRESRKEYFEKQSHLNIDVNFRPDTMLESLTIKHPIENIREYDYLYFEHQNKLFFYFILGKEMLTIDSSMLHVSLDVFTTYQFDVEFLESFVDRCHVNRWTDNGKPTRNTIDEGLDYGEVIQVGNVEQVTTFNDTIIMASSVPMGRLSIGSGGGSGGGSGNGWESGKLSAKGFRFIKGFEGYAPGPYTDSAGYPTIGYGVTKHGELDIYNELLNLYNNGKMNEEICAQKSYELKNTRYGAKIINKCKEIGISNQGQFDALVSFSYNLGNGVILDDTSTLTRAIKNNPNDRLSIESAFMMYVNAGGEPQPGLIARREEEVKMYFGENYQVRRITKIPYSLGYVTENGGDGWLPDDNELNGDIDTSKIPKIQTGVGEMLCPTYGRITACFPYYPSGGKHNGVDIAPPTPGGFARTFAMKDGVVIWAGEKPSGSGGLETYGNYVDIDHGNNILTRYAHHKTGSLQVKKGDNVKAGQVLGVQGDTGRANGIHLHFEVHDSSGRVQPYVGARVGEVIKKYD